MEPFESREHGWMIDGGTHYYICEFWGDRWVVFVSTPKEIHPNDPGDLY